MADRYRIVAEWNLPNGGIAQNVLHAAILGGEVADQDDLVTDIGDEVLRIFADWLTWTASNVLLALVRIYLFNEVTGTTTPVGVAVLNESGTGTVQSLPAGVAVKINQYAAGRARPYGSYLPGADEAGALNQGLISGTMQAAALATGVEGTVQHTMPLTALQYRPRGYSRVDGILVDLIGAEVEVGDVFDYQRRRKQGVGV